MANGTPIWELVITFMMDVGKAFCDLEQPKEYGNPLLAAHPPVRIVDRLHLNVKADSLIRDQLLIPANCLRMEDPVPDTQLFPCLVGCQIHS